MIVKECTMKEDALNVEKKVISPINAQVKEVIDDHQVVHQQGHREEEAKISTEHTAQDLPRESK